MKCSVMIGFEAEDLFIKGKMHDYVLHLKNVSDRDLKEVTDEERLFQLYQLNHELYLMKETAGGPAGFPVATDAEPDDDGDYELNKYRDFEALSESLFELADRAYGRAISFNALKQYRLELLEKDIVFL